MNNTKVIHEELEQNNIYVEIGKLLIKALKFGFYAAISFLELFIRVVKVLFNLNDYRPFQSFTDSKNSYLNNIAARNIDKYKVQYVSDHLSRHEYNFQRSDQFLAQYNYLQKELKQIADNEILINEDIYKDIFKRVSILISEAENKALQEGYNHARRTNYKLYGDEITEDYIRDKVLRGESNTNWGDLKERLNNE